MKFRETKKSQKNKLQFGIIKDYVIGVPNIIVTVKYKFCDVNKDEYVTYFTHFKGCETCYDFPDLMVYPDDQPGYYQDLFRKK